MDTAQDLMYDLKDAWTRNRVRRQQSRRSSSVKLGEQEKEYWTKAKLEDAVKLAQQNLAASKAGPRRRRTDSSTWRCRRIPNSKRAAGVATTFILRNA